MKKQLFFLVALVCICCSSYAKAPKFEHYADFNVIIPLPAQVETVDGKSFSLADSMVIGYSDESLAGNARLLAEYINETTGLTLFAKAEKGNIQLNLKADISQNPEAYTLTVGKEGIVIDGASAAGNFYGCQTLRKALPVLAGDTATIKGIEVPYVKIADEPVFPYRGAHLDCSRHFFPAEFVKRYIDILAMHNINNFHWHLTDDQGWRIEIKSMPELAEKGSIRKKTMIKKQWETFDETPHTGYYTQEQAKEIVEYAAQRHINVIPEIDMPGHMVAALHVYPELGCTGGPYEVWPIWGVAKEVMCAGNPRTMEFIKQVLGEIVEVFPSHYIHIGGDECPRDAWKKCKKCQAFADKMGFTGEHREARLQNYIMAEAEKFLNEHSREIIGWDEILEGEVSPTATIMSWRGSVGGIEAAKAGHKVIMTPNDYCYFDHYQSEGQNDSIQDKEPFGICCYLPLEKVYELTPCPEELSEEEGKFILGPQCNVWTEYIHTTDHVEYMLLPRLAALSESGWTLKKDFADFERRLASLIKLYDAYGLHYRPRNEEAQKRMVETINAGYNW